MHLSDEALSGLGTTYTFLSTSLFGAITQIYNPHARAPHRSHPTHVTRPPEPDMDAETTTDITMYESEEELVIFESDDPYIPTKPARRKSPATATQAQTPPVHHALYHQIKERLTDSLPFIGYFAAGGLAGITSRTATAPLDRLKVYLIAQTGGTPEAIKAAKKGAVLQATKHGASSMWKACKEIWADGGIRSLFAGMSVKYS